MTTRSYKDIGCFSVESSEADAETPIPESLIGFYVEHIVCNYTNEPVYYLNSVDHLTQIPIVAVGHMTARSFVEIIHRRVSGCRIKSKGRLIAGSRAWRTHIEIQFDTLLEGPVFITELAAVISTSRHKATMLNPASKSYRDKTIHDLHDQLGLEMLRNPISIVANDPSGTYPYLYTIINGEIVAVVVKHYQGYDETDGISLLRRDRNSTDFDYRLRRKSTTFADLKRMPEMTWVIDGYRITPHIEILQTWLRDSITPIVDRNVIAIKDHQVRIDEMCEQHAGETKVYKDHEAAQKREIATLKQQLEQAKNPIYAEDSNKIRELEQELRFKQLAYEADKLTHDRITADQKQTHEKVTTEQKHQHEKDMSAHAVRMTLLEAEAAAEKRRAEKYKNLTIIISATGTAIGVLVKYWKPILAILRPAVKAVV